MSNWRNSTIVPVIFIALVVLFGCEGMPEGILAADLSKRVATIDPSDSGSIESLLQVAQDIDTAFEQRAISVRQRDRLAGDLREKFTNWVRARVNELDPSKEPGFMEKFVNLTKFQETDIYAKWRSKEVHEYKENVLKKKFDQWVRHRVDELDPSKEPGFMEKFVNLTKFQETDIYAKWRSKEVHEYKENVLKKKFDQWVRHRVDELDPADPDFIKKVSSLTAFQEADIFRKWCSKEAHEYKEKKLKEKLVQYARPPQVTPVYPPVYPPVAPPPPVYPSTTAELEASWKASCGWSSEANIANLTVDFAGKDLTNGSALVTRVVVEVDGKVVHDSGSINVVTYSKSIVLQVSKGSHSIRVWATNARGQRAETATVIVCG